MRKKHPESDVNRPAHHLVQMPTTQTAPVPAAIELPVNLSEYMAAIGQRGGRIGGKRRLDTMTDEECCVVASNAAKIRWARANKAAK